MPMSGSNYVAPTWVDKGPPAISASELQAMCDTIVQNQGDAAALEAAVQALTTTVGGKAQIVTGSYAGTGTSGSSNPNSLTFDSNPSFLIVYLSGIAIGNGYFFNCFFWVPGTSSIEINGSGSTYTARFSQSGNQISWYANNAGPQLNQSGNTYNYIAIL